MDIQQLITEYLSSEQIVEDLKDNKHLKNEHFSAFINEKYHLLRPYHPDLTPAFIGRQLAIYEKQNPNVIFKRRVTKGNIYLILQKV